MIELVIHSTHSPRSYRTHRAVIRIGSDAASDICYVDHEAVSREHATIEFQPEADGGWYVLRDTSSNGTFVHGRRVDNHLLRDGDRIQFGKDVGPEITVHLHVPLESRPAPHTDTWRMLAFIFALVLAFSVLALLTSLLA
jgi:pSer/pThr/pTyr-binding forkhead associated (FHA) protein